MIALAQRWMHPARRHEDGQIPQANPILQLDIDGMLPEKYNII